MDESVRINFLKARPPRKFLPIDVEICTVSEYMASGRSAERAGVILLTTHKGRTNFCLGVHKTNNLTDFGGTVYEGENSIVAALREFHEETLGIFNRITPEDVADCIVIHNSYNLVIFIRTPIDPEIICRKFSEKLLTVEYSELICIMFFSEIVFDNMLHNGKYFYYRLGFFLCQAPKFYHLL
jgi:hypothetical protein